MEQWIINALIGWFIGFVLHQKLSLPYHFKRVFNIHVTRNIKLLDCYPCFTFWVTIILTFNPLSAILAYLISLIISKKI